MSKYNIIFEEIQSRIDDDTLTYTNAEKINILATEKYDDNDKSMVNFEKEYQQIKSEVDKCEINHKNTYEKVDNAIKTYHFTQPKKDMNKVYTDALMLQSKIIKLQKKSNSNKFDSLKSRVDRMIKNDQSKIQKVKKAGINNKLNEYDNKYWLDYTRKHREAFKETEKELLGHNTKRGLEHDYDKVIMYHFLPAPLAHKLHVAFSKHHSKAKTKEDYIQMMIDWECNRKTKPDKQMKPYQVIDAFYPQLKSTMIPILKEYGLPTNAQEDAQMERMKKLKEPFKKLVDKK